MAEQYAEKIREAMDVKENALAGYFQNELNKALDSYQYALKQVSGQIKNSTYTDLLENVFFEFDVDMTQYNGIIQFAYLFTKDQVQEVIREQGGNLSDIAAFVNFNPPLTRGADKINTRKGFLDKTLTKTTNKEVRRILQVGIGEGLPYQEIEQNLMDNFAFSQNRSELIARTETAFALNESQTAYMEELGVDQYTIDLAADACDQCITEYSNKTFRVGQDAPPPLHPRCRCVQKTVIPAQWLQG